MKKIIAFITFAISLLVFIIIYFYDDIFLNVTNKEDTQVEVENTVKNPTDRYACINQDNVYLYSDEDEDMGIFILPKTYYVKIIANGINFTYVQYLEDVNCYKSIYGYCKTSELTFVDYQPQQPYLFYTFPIEYYYGNINDSTLPDKESLQSITLNAIYYGDYLSGTKTYCYILRDNTFGYILKNNTINFQSNSEYAERNNKIEQIVNKEDINLPRNNLIKIILLCGVAFLILVVIFVLARKNTQNSQPDYYTIDERDRFY